MTKRNIFASFVILAVACGSIGVVFSNGESTEKQETKSNTSNKTTQKKTSKKEKEEEKTTTTEEQEIPATEEDIVDYSYDYNTNVITYYTAGGSSYTQTLTDGETIDFASQGVLYDGDTRYTYYSSNAAYHYQTPEWNLGDDGIYRTNEGYVVVASSDYEQGTIISTPFGDAQVLDSGCSSGTVDVYTAF